MRDDDRAQEALIGSEELGALLGISRRQVRDAAQRGHLPGFKIGPHGVWRFRADEVLAALRVPRAQDD